VSRADEIREEITRPAWMTNRDLLAARVRSLREVPRLREGDAKVIAATAGTGPESIWETLADDVEAALDDVRLGRRNREDAARREEYEDFLRARTEGFLEAIARWMHRDIAEGDYAYAIEIILTAHPDASGVSEPLEGAQRYG
jgi:hypothetical protein